jgi:hypothetical protein
VRHRSPSCRPSLFKPEPPSSPIAQPVIPKSNHGESPSSPFVTLHPAPSDPYPKSSGVAVNPECLAKYQELKLGHKHKYIIYTLGNKNTEIVVEKTSQASEYEDFLSDLPEADCRWAVYDFEYEQDGGRRNKITFYSW